MRLLLKGRQVKFKNWDTRIKHSRIGYRKFRIPLSPSLKILTWSSLSKFRNKFRSNILPKKRQFRTANIYPTSKSWKEVIMRVLHPLPTILNMKFTPHFQTMKTPIKLITRYSKCQLIASSLKKTSIDNKLSQTR